jgi:hypothetical protein
MGLKPLSSSPLRWLLGGSQWIPEYGDMCRMTEDHGMFSKDEFVVVDSEVYNDDFVTVSKLTNETKSGKVPIDYLRLVEETEQ